MVSLRDNKWLTEFSNPTEFCSKYTWMLSAGCNYTESCHSRWEEIAKKEAKPLIFECLAGLTCFIVPIFCNGIYIASIAGGQFLVEPIDGDRFSKLASLIDADNGECLNAAQKLKIIPTERVRAIMELLFVVSNTVVSAAQLNMTIEQQKIGCVNPLISKVNTIQLKNVGDSLDKDKFLTNREYQVLGLIVKGRTNNEIAKELSISSHTAKAHVASIIDKFGVGDRVQVAVKATRERLV